MRPPPRRLVEHRARSLHRSRRRKSTEAGEPANRQTASAVGQSALALTEATGPVHFRSDVELVQKPRPSDSTRRSAAQRSTQEPHTVSGRADDTPVASTVT